MPLKLERKDCIGENGRFWQIVGMASFSQLVGISVSLVAEAPTPSMLTEKSSLGIES